MSDPNGITLHGPLDREGWSHALLLGTDNSRGWTLEFSMENGEFSGAIVAAGQDAMLLIRLTEMQLPDGSWRTEATVRVEHGEADYNPLTGTLRVTDPR